MFCIPQDVFLMVRREKQTIFLDATEEVTVLQLKKKLEPIVKRSPEDQRLYNIDTKEPLDDKKSLGDCGYKAQSARAQDPGSIGLAFRLSETLIVPHDYELHVCAKHGGHVRSVVISYVNVQTGGSFS